MNGLFGNFQTPTMFTTPQQNVAQYLRMPVVQAAPQQQYPSIGEFIKAVQPQPQQQGNGLDILQRISGYGTPVATPQTQPAELTPAEKIILHISGGYNTNTTS
jgi:hypothetical protein